MDHENQYYNSKHDSVTAAGWCFLACAILMALAAMSYLFGGLA